MKILIMLIFGLALLISGCSSTPPTDSPKSSSTKGKQINDCMAKGSPEECDRQVNRRMRSY